MIIYNDYKDLLLNHQYNDITFSFSILMRNIKERSDTSLLTLPDFVTFLLQYNNSSMEATV